MESVELKRTEEIGMADRADIAGAPGERPGSEAADFERLDPKEVLRSKRWYWVGRRTQENLLENAIKYLKPDGTILLATNNRFAISYFAGASYNRKNL